MFRGFVALDLSVYIALIPADFSYRFWVGAIKPPLISFDVDEEIFIYNDNSGIWIVFIYDVFLGINVINVQWVTNGFINGENCGTEWIGFVTRSTGLRYLIYIPHDWFAYPISFVTYRRTQYSIGKHREIEYHFSSKCYNLGWYNEKKWCHHSGHSL